MKFGVDVTLGSSATSATARDIASRSTPYVSVATARTAIHVPIQNVSSAIASSVRFGAREAIGSRRYTCTTIFSTGPKPKDISLMPAGGVFLQPATGDKPDSAAGVRSTETGTG